MCWLSASMIAMLRPALVSLWGITGVLLFTIGSVGILYALAGRRR